MPDAQPNAPTPDAIDSFLQAGLLLEEGGALSQAEPLYREAVSRRPADAEANNRLGRLLVRLDRPQPALEFLVTALQAAPDQVAYWVDFIQGLAAAGMIGNARQALAQAAAMGMEEGITAQVASVLDTVEAALAGSRPAAVVPDAATDPASPLSAQPAPASPAAPTPTPSAPVPDRPRSAAQAELLEGMQAMLQLYSDGAHAKVVERGRKLARRFPNQPEVYEFITSALQAEGRLAEAIEAAQRVVDLSPADAGALIRLALLLKEAGRTAEAEPLARRAIALDPDSVEAHNALGGVLQDQAKAPPQRPTMRVGSRVRAEALVNRGNAEARKGKAAAAERSYREAIARDPELAEAYSNLGALLREQKRLPEAEAAFRRAAELKPANAEIASNLGVTLRDQKRIHEAEAAYRQAITLRPDYPHAHNNLANALLDQGRFEQAEASYRAAIALDADFAEAWSNLGNALRELKRKDEAEAAYAKAIAIDPKLAGAHANLGNLLKDRGALAEAEASYRRAIALNPRSFVSFNNLGNVLMHQGRLKEAVVAFRQALTLEPEHVPTLGNLLFCLTHDQRADPQAIFAEHVAFGRRVEKGIAPAHHPAQPARRDERPRVGFVSGDLRGHAVAHYIAPLWELMAQRGWELHAYHNNSDEDQVSARLRAASRGWNQVLHWDDAELARRIQADGIDVLFDLSGHTAFNRLSVFAMKPAPVQVTWIGYPGTTGLSRMDYYVGNPYLTPPGLLDDQFTEKLVQIPATTVFDPVITPPALGPLPALANGHVTFGSFNRIVKSGDAVLETWGEVLRAVPTARFLIGGMRDDKLQADVRARFARIGIGEDRLLLRPRAVIGQYLAFHNEVDLLLDSFPYAGATTTCFGLLMGVPTVTLAGRTVPARVGVSMLSQCGLHEFIAQSPEEFVRIAVGWAGRLSELAALRDGMRARFAQGLQSAARVADGLEAAVLTMWRRHCDGLAPAGFSIPG